MKFKLLFSSFIALLLFQFVPAQNIPVSMVTSSEYQLGPGDEVSVVVLGNPDYNFTATVNETGVFSVLFSEKPVVAKCHTETELKSEIVNRLSKYIKVPQISVTIKRNRPPAIIYGEVRNPQQIGLMRKSSLLDVLSFSGGATDEAGGMIQIFRPQAPLCVEASDDSNWKASSADPTDIPSRMYSLVGLRLGKEDSNPTIYPGDIIVVQKAAPVYITGEVVAPQGLYIKDRGLSLVEALAKVGGPRTEAKTKDITIRRLKADSRDKYDIISANLDLIKKGQQKDIMLQPYDIVEVDKARDSIAKSILNIALGAGKGGISTVIQGLSYKVLY